MTVSRIGSLLGVPDGTTPRNGLVGLTAAGAGLVVCRVDEAGAGGCCARVWASTAAGIYARSSRADSGSGAAFTKILSRPPGGSTERRGNRAVRVERQVGTRRPSSTSYYGTCNAPTNLAPPTLPGGHRCAGTIKQTKVFRLYTHTSARHRGPREERPVAAVRHTTRSRGLGTQYDR